MNRSRDTTPAALFLALSCGAFAAAISLRVARSTMTFPVLLEFVPSIATVGVGVLLLWKRPDNLISWILAGFGLLRAFVEATSALFEPWPGGELSAVELALVTIDGRIFLLNFGFVAALLHTFPTGRATSTFWSKVGRVVLIAFVLTAIQVAFTPGPVNDEAPVGVANPMNPIAVTGPAWTVINAVGTAATAVFLIGGLVGGIASLVVRYRRGTPTEKLQLKWFASAAAVFGAMLLANVPLRSTGIISLEVLDRMLSVASLGLPVSIAIAVLRYRLWDIDRLVSRTVSYAIVTAFLGGIFALVVLLPPLAFGGDSAPDYVIAIATLVVAALFRPVRRRVQEAVDHRFNRRRYDAEHTIEAFTARLREQIDIDALAAELNTVVSKTMQPAHVALWIKPSGSRR